MKKKLLVVIAMLVVASGIIFTGSTSTKAEDNEVQYLGKYKLTAYCGCKKCSGKWGTRTASGKKAKQGRTIAVDKRKIKLAAPRPTPSSPASPARTRKCSAKSWRCWIWALRTA